MFMLTVFIFSLLGAVWTINITILENPVNGTEQLSVYLPVVVSFPENFLLTWRIGGRDIATLTAGGTPAYWSGYGGRAELYPNNGTLRLDRLQLTDTGDYTVVVINQNNSDSSQATISLAVHHAAPTVGITVIENPVNGTRGQAAYFLVQISFPTQFQLHWRIEKTGLDIASLLAGDDSPVYYGSYKGRAQLFPENGTLRLDNLADSDRGGYKVSLLNGDLGTQTEAVLQLNVYTRLYKPIVTITPRIVEQGHKVTLHCNISDGNDTVFSWFKDDQYITCGADNICSDNSPELVITSTKESDEGNYNCSVKNPVSNNASDVLELKVYVRVSKPIVTVTPEVVREDDNVTLNCSTTAGNRLTYTWYTNSSKPNCSDHYKCSNESSELIIKFAKSTDTGNYGCTAENQLNKETSDFTNMTVYHGPSSLTLHIPAENCSDDWIDWFKVPGAVCVHENTNLSMSCEAQSLPQSNYSWSFSNVTSTGVLIEASEVMIYNFNSESDGNYTCTASNDVTGRNSSQSRYLIAYQVPNGSATISYSKQSDNNLINVSCCWKGGKPEANILLEHNNISIKGTEIVTTEVREGAVSCLGEHLFQKSKTELLLEMPEPDRTSSSPSKIMATVGHEVTLAVILSSGKNMLDRAQFGNKEILPAIFKWFHPNEGEIHDNGKDNYNISSTTEESVFIIFKFAEKHDKGLYICTATNMLGSVNITFQIDIKQAGPNVGLIVGATIGAIAAAVLIGVTIYFIVKYANKKKGSQTGSSVNNAHMSSTEPAVYVNVHANTQQETRVKSPREVQPEHIYMSLDQRKDSEYITLEGTRKFQNWK